MPWHLTLASEDRLTLFPTESLKRRAVRALIPAVPEMLLFSIVDDHVHVVLGGQRGDVGRRAQALALALRPHAAPRLAPARIREVKGRAHLESLVGYVLRQGDHHGLAGAHPLRDVGSCLPDLVGARLLGFDDRALCLELPRAGRARWLSAAGFGPPAPPAKPALPAVLAAAAELVALDDLRCKSRAGTAARAAAVHAAAALGFGSAVLAEDLQITPRAVQRLAATPAHPAFAAALATRLALASRGWTAPAERPPGYSPRP